jgi:hypothetical protein
MHQSDGGASAMQAFGLVRGSKRSLNGAVFCERGFRKPEASESSIAGEQAVSRLRGNESIERIDTGPQKRVDDSGAANIIRDPNAAGTSSAASVLEN